MVNKSKMNVQKVSLRIYRFASNFSPLSKSKNIHIYYPTKWRKKQVISRNSRKEISLWKEEEKGKNRKERKTRKN